MQEEPTLTEADVSLEQEQTAHTKKIVVGALFNGHVYAHQGLAEDSFKGVSIDQFLQRELPRSESKNLIQLCISNQSLDLRAVTRKIVASNAKSELLPLLTQFSKERQLIILDELLTSNTVGFVLENMAAFDQIQRREIIDKVVKSDLSRHLVRHILLFEPEDRHFLQDIVINSGDLGAIIDNIDVLPNLSHDWILETLIDSPERYKENVLVRLEIQMPNLDFSPEVLKKFEEALLANNNLNPAFLLRFPRLFPNVDKSKIISKLTMLPSTDSILDYSVREEIKGIDDTKIVLFLLTKSDLTITSLATSFFNYSQFDRQQVFAYLTSIKAYTAINHFYAEYFSFFPKKDLYNNLLELKLYEDILDSYYRFESFIDHKSLLTDLLSDKELHPLLQTRAHHFMAELGDEVVINLLVKHEVYKSLVDSRVLSKYSDRVLKILQEKNCFDLITREYESFPQLDFRELLLKIIAINSDFSEISHGFLRKFLSTETYWCVNTLFSLDKHNLVADFFHFFDKDQLAHVVGKKRLLKEFLSRGYGKVLFENPSFFSTLDPLELTDVVISEGKVEQNKLLSLVRYLNIEQKKELAKVLLESGKIITLVVNIHHFTELGPEFTSAILNSFTAEEQVLLLENYVETKNYEALKELLIRSEVTFAQSSSEFEAVVKELQTLLGNKNHEQARKLLEIVHILFPQKAYLFKEIEEHLESTHAKQEKKEVRRGFNSLRCLPEIYRFYLLLSLRKKYGAVFDTTELGRSLNKEITALFNKVREYSIVAVVHELENDFMKDTLLQLPFTDRRIFNTGTSEEIRTFFNQASAMLTANFGKMGAYGGEKWSMIADHGEKMWDDAATEDVSLQTTLLNLAVSLQHNTGTYFDKDQPRVFLENTKLHKLLTFEAKGNRSLEDFLEYGASNTILATFQLEQFKLIDQKLAELANGSEVKASSLRATTDTYVETTRDVLFRRIANDPALPDEVKLFSQTIHSHEGYTRERIGPILLGRLAKTLGIHWTIDDGYVKTFSTNTDKVIFLDVQGFAFAFWYKDGVYQSISSPDELKKRSAELELLFGRTIVPAHYGYTKEGD